MLDSDPRRAYVLHTVTDAIATGDQKVCSVTVAIITWWLVISSSKSTVTGMIMVLASLIEIDHPLPHYLHRHHCWTSCHKTTLLQSPLFWTMHPSTSYRYAAALGRR